jgi:homoserine kinase
MSTTNWVEAVAPATSANVSVGFDLLGFAFGGLSDRVRLRYGRELQTTVSACSDPSIPLNADKNTAAVAAKQLLLDHGLRGGFELEIKKGIPVGSGLGGSAASSVAATLAAHACLLANGLIAHGNIKHEHLLQAAMTGEAVASGGLHADNVAPSLFGGLTLVFSGHTRRPEVVSLPVPDRVEVVLVHPNLKIETKQARAILKKEVLLSEHVQQSGCLAGFLAACFKNDLQLLRRTMLDLVIAPQRSALIPGFDEAQAAALGAGAIGFSISGSGPTVFAWCEQGRGHSIAEQVKLVFAKQNLNSQAWVGPILQKGAHVVS